MTVRPLGVIDPFSKRLRITKSVPRDRRRRAVWLTDKGETVLRDPPVVTDLREHITGADQAERTRFQN